MSDWIMMIPSLVFTKLKRNFSTKTMKKFNMTDENFSSLSNANKEPTFPFVYLQLLPGIEIGEDLERTTINGQELTFQVDVTDNCSKETARLIMAEVLKGMKKMSFSVVGTPHEDNTDDTFRYIARFRRLISKNDCL